MAAKIKMMELAKELGVTSKELMVAAEEWVRRQAPAPDAGAAPGEPAVSS